MGQAPATGDGPSLLWLRDDLRLADNPALAAAVARGRPLIVLHVLDEASAGIRPLGGAARWWLHHSLIALAESLAAHGQTLLLRRGEAGAVVAEVARAIKAGAVFWNRRYGPGRQVDAGIKAALRARGVAVESFQANLLFEPWTVVSRSGGPFRVFSAFWRACLAGPTPRMPIAAPSAWPPAIASPEGDALDDWKLLPRRPDWAGGLRAAWRPGEAGALARLHDFLDSRLRGYAEARDGPGLAATSRLSPHLRFGEISPFQLWHGVEAARHAAAPAPAERDIAKFLSELGWREFDAGLLFHRGDLATRSLDPRFDAFPWRDSQAIDAWRQGRTGYPIVDAGMRELWQTGWMHNRVRMIAASFLVKNLLADWRIGEAWFWDTLVDADAASNPANWQWVAGSGSDAAPYFRIFNPVRQGEAFDADGAYVRRFVPELAALAGRDTHQPWRAGGAPGYPEPIVELQESRERALRAFAGLPKRPQE